MRETEYNVFGTGPIVLGAYYQDVYVLVEEVGGAQKREEAGEQFPVPTADQIVCNMSLW